MSSSQSPNHVARADRFFRLHPAEDRGLAEALRECENAFNEDVLPRNAKLRAPIDFYAASAAGPSLGGTAADEPNRHASQYSLLISQIKATPRGTMTVDTCQHEQGRDY